MCSVAFPWLPPLIAVSRPTPIYSPRVRSNSHPRFGRRQVDLLEPHLNVEDRPGSLLGNGTSCESVGMKHFVAISYGPNGRPAQQVVVPRSKSRSFRQTPAVSLFPSSLCQGQGPIFSEGSDVANHICRSGGLVVRQYSREAIIAGPSFEDGSSRFTAEEVDPLGRRN